MFGRLLSVIMVLGLLGLWAAGLYAEPRQHLDMAGRASLPVQFDSEIVRIFVEEDSLRIDGLYRLVCRDTSSIIPPLFYPDPADSLLGDARTLLLEARCAGEEWQSLPLIEHPQRPGVRWRFPQVGCDSVDVHTVYRQARWANYGRYIVTTTQAWGRPLRHARFEVYLPAGARPVDFSFPFRRQEASNAVYYLFEADDFLPDRDIRFTWEP